MFGTDPQRIARFAEENPEVKKRVKILSGKRSLTPDEVEGFPNLEEIHSPVIITTLTLHDNLEKMMRLKNLRLLTLTLVDLKDFFPLDDSEDSDSSSEDEDEDFSPAPQRKRPVAAPRRGAKRRKVSPASKEGKIPARKESENYFRKESENYFRKESENCFPKDSENYFRNIFPAVVSAIGSRLGEMDLSVAFLENLGFFQVGRDFAQSVRREPEKIGEESETESEEESETEKEKKVSSAPLRGLGLSPYRFTLRGGFLRCYPSLQPCYRPLVEALAKAGGLRGIFLDGECLPLLPKDLALSRVEMTAAAEKKTRRLFMPLAEEISLLLSGEGEPESFLAQAEEEILHSGGKNLRELAAPLSLSGAEEALSLFPRLELCGVRLESQSDCSALLPILGRVSEEKEKDNSLFSEKILILYRALDVDVSSLLKKGMEVGADVRTCSLESLFSPLLNGSQNYDRETIL